MLGKTIIKVIVVLLALVPLGVSQAAPTTAASVAVSGSPMRGPAIAFHTEVMDTAPVKGSPFCATVTNDHTQLFADGNKIHTTESSLLCRDSEGRVRRESQLDLLGAVPQGVTPKIITITDPVAGVRYMLDTFSKIARKMPLGPMAASAVGGPKAEGQNVMFYSKSGAIDGPPPLPEPGGDVFIQKRVLVNGPPGEASGGAAPKTENLGQQAIDGFQATGTRITTTIPAGKMGNEQPITIVSERWYSPELKATVMTKHTDPWAGTLTTQFSNVNTAEPDPSLFTVPSDYKVVDAKSGPVQIEIRRESRGPQQSQ